MSTAKHEQWMQGTEPNDQVIRNYCYSNVGGDIKIIDDVTALRNAYFLFQRVHKILHLENVAVELDMLQEYLRGDNENDYLYCDSMYGKKMLTLFKMGIPR
jgi:hypothetical protein